jgi:hypothetical protein
VRDERFVTPLGNSTNQPIDTEFLRGCTEVTEVQNPSSQLGRKVQGARCMEWGKWKKRRMGERVRRRRIPTYQLSYKLKSI